MEAGKGNFPNESELRSLDVTTLASKSRQSWDRVKSQIPSEIRSELEPHFNVLTDPSYIRQQMEVAAESSSPR